MVQSRENGHLDACQDTRYPDSKIGAGNISCRSQGAFTCRQELYEVVLPETQENDEFETEDFEERSVAGEVIFELNMELDDAVHCNGCG